LTRIIHPTVSYKGINQPCPSIGGMNLCEA
jgi:hypothetical protein